MLTDDIIQTFDIENLNLRGRILRCGNMIDSIMRRHDYPEAVTLLLGEAVAVAITLSSMLKYEGIFTLQIQGDGPVGMLVVDITSGGNVRACARFSKDEVSQAGTGLSNLIGSQAFLAFTVDQGEDTERYQGIVSLSDMSSLQDGVRHYFKQSEQIDTAIRLHLGKSKDGQWRAGAIMLQKLPEHVHPPGETDEDGWRRSMILLQSCTDEELIDPDLPQTHLLYRLFNEDVVRVFDPLQVVDQCRCSMEKAKSILGMISGEERDEMVVGGKFVITCEFCSREYTITEDEYGSEKNAKFGD